MYKLLYICIVYRDIVYQFFQVVESSNVLVVEEDLRHRSPPCPLLHLIASPGVTIQVYLHEWNL